MNSFHAPRGMLLPGAPRRLLVPPFPYLPIYFTSVSGMLSTVGMTGAAGVWDGRFLTGGHSHASASVSRRPGAYTQRTSHHVTACSPGSSAESDKFVRGATPRPPAIRPWNTNLAPPADDLVASRVGFSGCLEGP